MGAIAINKENEGKAEQRGKSIASMGLVNREGGLFRVSAPGLRGKNISHEVKRDGQGKIICNCLLYEEGILENAEFRCEHIYAVRFAILSKNTEATARNGENVTELPESAGSEQGFDGGDADDLIDGRIESEKAGPESLAYTKGDRKMNSNTKEKAAVKVNKETINTGDNVFSLNFGDTLRNLRNVNPELIRQRDGWRGRDGQVHRVDYVEWHTVADILDKEAPDWGHSVKDIRQIGNFITITVAITIDGVTREGLGTGLADSEIGIKKAEHDALKRAAVKFGIARDLYKKEYEAIQMGYSGSDYQSSGEAGFPADPLAKNLAELVSAKQLGMIRAISRERGIDANAECKRLMACKCDELTKKAASALIDHLQSLQNQPSVAAPMRHAA